MSSNDYAPVLVKMPLVAAVFTRSLLHKTLEEHDPQRNDPMWLPHRLAYQALVESTRGPFT